MKEQGKIFMTSEKPVRIGMIALGCNKNQVDAELMLGRLADKGFEICEDAYDCDVVIVNTCGFIESAKKESIENILECCEMKKQGNVKLVVVTGCLAERYREEMAELIPEADVILGIGSNDEIVTAINQALEGKKVRSFYAPENLEMEGKRILVNYPHYAYIRIADGCDNKCSYCAIPMIRGRFRSRPMENIVAECRHFAEKGVDELIIIAQDTTRYGEDIYGKKMLPELLRQICAIDGIKWVRILYAYPERVTEELLDTIASEDKICKYLDIPLQHCSPKILRAMKRKANDSAKLLEFIKHIRKKVPGIALRTTLLTGFPGENEDDFEALCKFVKAAKFDRLGCFAYSREEGTASYNMTRQLDEETKERRAEVIMGIQTRVSKALLKKKVGTETEVVVEGYDNRNKVYIGRSSQDAPEIDGVVYFVSDKKYCIGDFVKVRIAKSSDYDLLGEAMDEDREEGIL